MTAGSQVRNSMPGDGGSAFSLHIAASFLLVPGGSSIRQAIALFYVTRLACPVLPLCPVIDCHCLRFEKMHNLENESIWRVIIDKGRVLVRFNSNFPISGAVERAGAHTKSRSEAHFVCAFRSGEGTAKPGAHTKSRSEAHFVCAFRSGEGTAKPGAHTKL